MTEQEQKAVEKYAKKASIDTLIISNCRNESMKAYCEGVHNGILMGAQFLDELRKPSEPETNVGDDFTNDKIIFGTLPDGTNVITVIGKNIRNESYIRQQVGVHSSVFDVLKKKIESKPSEPDKELLEALKEYVWMQEGCISKVSTTPQQRLENAKRAISKYETK